MEVLLAFDSAVVARRRIERAEADEFVDDLNEMKGEILAPFRWLQEQAGRRS